MSWLFLNGLDKNFFYLKKFSFDGYALLSERRNVLFSTGMDGNYVKSLAKKSGSKFEVVTYSSYSEFKKILRKFKGNFSINEFNLRVSEMRILKKRRLRLAGRELAKRRSVKNEEEIGKIAKACKHAREIIEEVGENLKKGDGERKTAQELLVKTAEMGLEKSFDPIVAFDTDTRFPHSSPGNRKLKRCALIDYGVKYENYCSDITRMYFVGNDGETRMLQNEYKRIREVFNETKDEIRAGKKASEINEFANALLKKRKMHMPHSIGHGIGLEVHEFPRFKSDDVLKKGMVFTIEPGNYGKYGFRHEDVFVLRGRARRA